MVESDHREMACTQLPADYKLVFVFNGRLGIEREGVWHDLRAGEFLLMRKEHRSRAAIAYPPQVVFFWVLFRGAPTMSTRTREPAGVVSSMPSEGCIHRSQRIADLFHMLLENQTRQRIAQPDSALLLQLILHECVESCKDHEALDADELIAQRVQQYVSHRFRDNISARDIAEALGINANYMSRAFRRATGMTPTECIIRHRLNESRLLLLENDLTVEQVAFRCGFNEPSYFRRMFKRSEQNSPTEFRRRVANRAGNSV